MATSETTYVSRLFKMAELLGLKDQVLAWMRPYYSVTQYPGWMPCDQSFAPVPPGVTLKTWYQHPEYEVQLRLCAKHYGITLEEPEDEDLETAMATITDREHWIALHLHCTNAAIDGSDRIAATLSEPELVRALKNGELKARAKALAEVRTPACIREWLVKHGYL